MKVLIYKWVKLGFNISFSLISVTVIKYPDKKQCKSLFGLKFQVIFHHCGEIKAGTQDSKSHHLQEQKE